MKSHFDQHLKLRDLILEKKPEVIVECGAGNGDCTKLLAYMKPLYPFDLYSITDKALEGITGVEWKIGLSYQRLLEFPDNSIGLCIIDTDHNYWTLMQELEAVTPKMKEGGLVVMHDVEEFYHNTGMAMSYWDDTPYPEKEIKACVKLGGLGDALMQFLVDRKDKFKLVHYTKESYGCAVIEKRTTTQTLVITPGTNPMFAKPVIP